MANVEITPEPFPVRREDLLRRRACLAPVAVAGLLATLTLVAAPGPALAAANEKQRTDPGALWDQYPLQPRRQGHAEKRGRAAGSPSESVATPRQPVAAQPSPSSGADGSSDGSEIFFGVAAAFLGAAALVLFARSRSAPHQGDADVSVRPAEPRRTRRVAPLGRSLAHAGRALASVGGEGVGVIVWYLAGILVGVGSAFLVLTLMAGQ